MNTQEDVPVRPRRADADAALLVVLHAATCTIAEAAAVLGQNERLVRRAVESGDIKTMRLGRNWRVLCAPLRRQLGIED